MIVALRRSQTIWLEMRAPALDTRKAYDVLGLMLERVSTIFEHQSLNIGASNGTGESSGYNISAPMEGLSLPGVYALFLVTLSCITSSAVGT
jgi:hypothetical protein